MRADNPFHEIFREQDEKEFLDLQSPVGESFPSDLKELVLGVARMEGHPV